MTKGTVTGCAVAGGRRSCGNSESEKMKLEMRSGGEKGARYRQMQEQDVLDS